MTPSILAASTLTASPGRVDTLRYRGAMADTEPATITASQSPWAAAPRSHLVDLGLVLLTLVPAMGSPFLAEQDFRAIDVVAAITAAGLILVRRRWPMPALGVALVAAVAVTAIAGQPTALLPATVILLFNVAFRTDRATSIRVGIAGVAAMLTAALILASNGFLGPELLAGVAWPALAVAAGDAVRSRREAIDAAEERAARAEATREEEARRRVAEERLHIARELHDVVAHHIAVINVQAGVAAHLLHTSPDGAETALATVRSSAHDVLDELAGILGVLRAGDDDSASTHPTPTVEDLPALVDSFAQAGLDVTFETTGEAHPASDVVAIAVYRTVQEALTNAHKHGAGAARVRLENRPDELELTVTNAVGAAVAATSGYGLAGMRERVQAAGGSLDTGARPDGTFVVHACFPRTRREQP
jgi:signal transduction histidine kinase